MQNDDFLKQELEMHKEYLKLLEKLSQNEDELENK